MPVWVVDTLWLRHRQPLRRGGTPFDPRITYAMLECMEIKHHVLRIICERLGWCRAIRTLSTPPTRNVVDAILLSLLSLFPIFRLHVLLGLEFKRPKQRQPALATMLLCRAYTRAETVDRYSPPTNPRNAFSKAAMVVQAMPSWKLTACGPSTVHQP